jgi:hypothetical protein
VRNRNYRLQILDYKLRNNQTSSPLEAIGYGSIEVTTRSEVLRLEEVRGNRNFKL